MSIDLEYQFSSAWRACQKYERPVIGAKQTSQFDASRNVRLSPLVTFIRHRSMSAIGPKRTWVLAPHMSAFGG
jgi:hypothetical protein